MDPKISRVTKPCVSTKPGPRLIDLIVIEGSVVSSGNNGNAIIGNRDGLGLVQTPSWVDYL